MKLEIKNIINKHKGTPAVVCGFGPSFGIVNSSLQQYKDRGHIIISCNNWSNFISSLPDYWVMASSVDTIKEHLTDINTFKIPVFFAESVDFTDKMIVEQIESDYLPYDQRHFKSFSCPEGYRKCCNNIVTRRLTIQEELKRYTGWIERYSTGHTVAVHMIAFAILMGCNPIYIAGIDLDYRLGYAKNQCNQIPCDPNELTAVYNETLSDLKVLDNSAKQMGISIINTNIKSTYNTLKIGKIE